jgi:hypothetical protein
VSVANQRHVSDVCTFVYFHCVFTPGGVSRRDVSTLHVALGVLRELQHGASKLPTAGRQRRRDHHVPNVACGPPNWPPAGRQRDGKTLPPMNADGMNTVQQEVLPCLPESGKSSRMRTSSGSHRNTMTW